MNSSNSASAKCQAISLRVLDEPVERHVDLEEEPSHLDLFVESNALGDLRQSPCGVGSKVRALHVRPSSPCRRP
jgi:hypothetical protein